MDIWTIVTELMFCIELFAAQLLFVSGVERRRFSIVKFIALAVLCILFFCFVPTENVFVESIKYIVGFAFLFFIVFICYKTSANYALFVSVCAYAMQHIIYCIIEIARCVYDPSFQIVRWIQLHGSISSGQYINIYMPINIGISALFFFVVYAAIYFFFIRAFKKEKQYKVGGLGQFFLSVTILASTMVINLLYRRLFSDIPVAAVVCLRIFAIISCAFAITIQMRTREKSKLEETNDLLERMLHTEAKRHEMSKENIELINIKCHDLKKQINTLKNIVNEEEKAKNIAEIEKAVMIYDNTAKTGNDALDVVLTEKSLICESDKIRFTYIVDGEKLGIMQTADVYTLFSNALDNAIESVRKLPEEKRLISLRIDAASGGGMLRINILNYFEGELEFIDGLPKTTGDDARYHGFGTRSMRYIAEKYGGTFVISAENNIFEVNILIPLAAA